MPLTQTPGLTPWSKSSSTVPTLQAGDKGHIGVLQNQTLPCSSSPDAPSRGWWGTAELFLDTQPHGWSLPSPPPKPPRVVVPFFHPLQADL